MDIDLPASTVILRLVERALVVHPSRLHLSYEFFMATVDVVKFDEPTVNESLKADTFHDSPDKHVKFNMLAEKMLVAHDLGGNHPHSHRPILGRMQPR